MGLFLYHYNEESQKRIKERAEATLEIGSENYKRLAMQSVLGSENRRVKEEEFHDQFWVLINPS